MSRRKNPSEKEAFGHAVRARREELGWSQEALGFEADLHRTYISEIERGVRNPTVTSIFKLARALEVLPSALFTAAEKALGRR